MTCKSCLQKAYEKYRVYGLNHETSVFMAKKLMKRVEKRQRKEKIRNWYKHVDSFLWRWTLLCNWKATLLWMVKLKRLMWIGDGFNPVYLLNCAGTCGTGICVGMGYSCDTAVDCEAVYGTCPIGTCACPAPSIPHSHQVTSMCGCGTPGYVCIYCSANLCQGNNFACSCSGVCGYDCDAGYHWDGVQCAVDAQLIQRCKIGVGL